MFYKLHWSGKKKTKKKSPTLFKNPFGSNVLIFSHLRCAAFFFFCCCFSISFKMHLCTEEMLKCGLQRERATYFHSDLVSGQLLTFSLFSKKQKKKGQGEYKPGFFSFSSCNTRGQTSLQCTHFIRLSLHSPFIQESSVIKKRQEQVI